MPSKEDTCLVQDSIPQNFISPDMEELVAAIKHNLHLKSKPSRGVYSKHHRMAPYAAPARKQQKNSILENEHSSPNCKYCMRRSKNSASDSQDPYEILTFLRKGILISEAVKRLQEDIGCKKAKKIDFYELEDEVENV